VQVRHFAADDYIRTAGSWLSRADDDDEHGCQQDRYRKRDGHQSNGCFHQGPIAIEIIACWK
jgi:hypothetical protein